MRSHVGIRRLRGIRLSVVRAVHIVVLALAGMCGVVWGQEPSPAPPHSAAAKPEGAPAAATASAVTPLSRYEGLPVREVKIQSQAAVVPTLVTQLAQRPNQPLDRKKIRLSVQQLFATRRFQDIQVEAEKDQQGEVTLVFVAEENY